VAVTNRMQRPIEGSPPEIQKLAHLGEIWGEIVILPNVGLQEGFKIRSAVKNVGGRQSAPLSWRSRSDENCLLHLLS
jgi:hypothetical protein